MSTEPSGEIQKESGEKSRERRLLTLIPIGSFGYAAVYNLGNLIFDVLLIPNYILGAFAVLILFGYIRKKAWTVWASIAYVPLVLAETIPTLQASVGLFPVPSPALVFQISLVVFAATSALSAILIVFDRSRFKQRAEPQPEGGQ